MCVNMALKRFIRNNAKPLINLAVDTVEHLRNSKIPEGPIPLEDIPVSGEELDALAEWELGGMLPEFGSAEEAEHFNEKLLEDVGRKTLDLEMVKAGVEGGYGHEAKTYPGQSDVDYCLECAVKHSQTASILMLEALQRAEAGGPGLAGVQEKVRGAVRELTGMEDDTETVNSTPVMALNTMARALRKHVYETKAEIGGASMEDIRDIKELSDKLVEASYLARQGEDCPDCEV